VTLSHYINDIYDNLIIKIERFIDDFNLLNKLNINKSHFDLIKDIISISDMNIDNDYTNRLNKINNNIHKYKLMDRAFKLDIPNLNKSLIQNQNDLKLIPKHSISQINNIEFPINEIELKNKVNELALLRKSINEFNDIDNKNKLFIN